MIKDSYRIIDVARKFNLTIEVVLGELQLSSSATKSVNRNSKITQDQYKIIEDKYLNNSLIKEEIKKLRTNRKKGNTNSTKVKTGSDKVAPRPKLTREQKRLKLEEALRKRREKILIVMNLKTIKKKRSGNSTSKKESPFDKIKLFSAKIIGKQWFLSKGKTNKLKRKKRKD